jgi:hypothetical protein
MKLKILNRDDLVQKFLLPITKISNICVLNLSKNKIHTFVNGDVSKNIIYCSSNQVEFDFEDQKLGIRDVRILISKLKQIPENTFELEITKNSICYSSNKLTFKHILVEERKIKIPNFKEDKLLSCVYDNKFVLKLDSLKTLIKCSTTLTESNKIYISTDGEFVVGELDDKSKRNIDTYTLILADNFNGAEIKTPISFPFEPFRVISTHGKSDVLVGVNTKNEIIEFDVSSDNYIVKYVTSALVN